MPLVTDINIFTIFFLFHHFLVFFISCVIPAFPSFKDAINEKLNQIKSIAGGFGTEEIEQVVDEVLLEQASQIQFESKRNILKAKMGCVFFVIIFIIFIIFILLKLVFLNL